MSRFPIDASSKLYTPLRLVTDPPQFSPGPNPPYFDPDFRSQRLLGGQIVTGGVANTVDLATRPVYSRGPLACGPRQGRGATAAAF